MDILSKHDLMKSYKTVRTYKFKIRPNKLLLNKFSHIQDVKKQYFNYGLQYLERKYNIKKIGTFYFPQKTVSRQYLICDMKNYAQNHALKYHDKNLTKAKINIQIIDKMYEELLTNYFLYQKEQYKVHHSWSDKQKKKYLSEHYCNLTGYCRINYKRSPKEIKSATVKDNGGQIKIINNYCINLPYFRKINLYQSISNFKHQKIIECRVLQKGNQNFELQIITKVTCQRHTNQQDLNNIVGLDVNMKNNEFFKLSIPNFKPITWPENIEKLHQQLDNKYRKLQHYLTTHNHGQDNSNTTKLIAKQRQKVQAKMSNVMHEWLIQVATQLVQQYPILAMEDLNSFGMRLSKRYNKHLRKNVNHKLATLSPTAFKKIMEYIYQDNGGILLEVDSWDSSKTCYYCGHINHDLKVGQKVWQCPNCQENLDRDYNATLNIKEWALYPNKHAKMQQLNRFPYLEKLYNKSPLLTYKLLVNVF